MIFRTSDRLADRRAPRDELLAAADRTFGRHPDSVAGDVVVVDAMSYVYDRTQEPAFVVLPTCSRCGGSDLEQFPLETCAVGDASVRRATRDKCRDCRFLELGNEPMELRLLAVPAVPKPIRRRTRRYRQGERAVS